MGSIQCGMTLYGSPSMRLNWPWYALWWRTTTRRQGMILSDSIPCLSHVFSKDTVISTSCLRTEPVFLPPPYLYMLESLTLYELNVRDSSRCLPVWHLQDL